MKSLINEKVLILGAGTSGTAAYELLKSKKISATLFDDSFKDREINAEDFDCCIISPGIPSTHPIASQFDDPNKPKTFLSVCDFSFRPIISELELGFSGKHRKIIAITGTNGKSTVTQHIAKAINLNKKPCIRKAVMCGNIGIPVTSVQKKLKTKTAVAEVSSFQLEHTIPHGSAAQSKNSYFDWHNFRPNIAVILNITQDHLERHKTMEEYIRCKSQIFAHQTKRDVLVLNYDDENCKNLASQTISKVLWFSSQARVHGIYLEGKNIMWNVRGKAKKIFSVDNFSDKAPHVIQNLLATTLVCRLMKVSKRAIKLAANTPKLEHRLQYVGKLTKNVSEKENPNSNSDLSAVGGEVLFYNDSKATNIASTLAACKCFETQIQLLVGGMPKGQNFTELFEKLPPNVQNIFAFGNAAPEIIKSHADLSHAQTDLPQPSLTLPNIHACIDLAEAVALATQNAVGPSVVLLSPACSSFDAYKNYAERGNHFIELAYEIINANKTL